MGMEDDEGEAPAMVYAGDGDCFLRISKKNEGIHFEVVPSFFYGLALGGAGETSYPILVSASLSSREIFSIP